jgi:N-acetylglucosaminyl-diphospho-decaprenol L-rhamnosyltransferase
MASPLQQSAPGTEVAAFVVHWRNPQACVRTVRALRSQSVQLSVTVIDNGSPEGERPVASELPAGTELVLMPDNLGYGPALNRLLSRWLEESRGEFALLCPHDALPEPDCVERILEVMRKRPRVGLLSAEYGSPTVPGYTLLRGYDLYPIVRGEGFCPSEYPNGTLLVVRRSCLNEIGLFDERYFAYSEECELGARALRAGWEVGQVWGAKVENPGRVAASPVVWYLNLRNGLLASRARDGIHAAVARTFVTLANGALAALRGAPSETTPPFGVRLRAVGDYWFGRFGAPPRLP